MKSPLILVADDDAAIRMLARTVLEQNGCTVVEAEDGEEAISVLKHERPDLMLLDVIMPKATGFDVCKYVRESGQSRWIPILMMTGLDDTKSISHAYEMGATDFITKPINWLILAQHVRFVLRAFTAFTRLVQAEAKDKALLNAIPDSMLRIRKDGNILESRGDTIPVTQSRELHTSAYEVLPTEAARQVMHHVREAIHDGDIKVLECQGAINGKVLDLEIRTVRCNDEEAVSIIRDITERKRTEKALKESQELYALASLAANDGLWDWDLVSTEIHYSTRWKALLGYTEDEIGKSIDEWLSRVHPTDQPQVKLEINNHLEGITDHFENEHRIMHADGSYRWMLSRGIAVRNETGKAYRMVGSQADISVRKGAEEQLLHEAFYDSLTGLPNRALFMDRLGHALKRAERNTNYLCAVLFVDLDRFKIINDSLGHLVGDQVLVEVARRLGECIRPGDTVARLGGDEFVMLIDDIKDAENAKKAAERVHQQLSVQHIVDGSEVFCTASIGIALSSPEYQKPDDILRDADITMYRAKLNGRSRFELFDPSMRLEAVALLHLENDLRKAFENNEFLVHYQPVVLLKEERIIGFEALVRWQHPHKGLISPVEFIPLAEETGLIVPLGEFVLRTACTQMREWEREGLPPLRIAVNISTVQLKQPGFADMVLRIIEETGTCADRLDLEITETILMEQSGATIEALQTLKAQGLHICLDDFGVGYSSLSYLQNLPIDVLKIDRSFVERLSSDAEQVRIIETILMLGKNLGIDVIAEGIETDEQLAHLKSINCRNGQGFLFSKPLDSDEARLLICTVDAERRKRAHG